MNYKLSYECNVPFSDRSIREIEYDLVPELVWQNGHVVTHSQSNSRRTPPRPSLMNNVEKTDIQGWHVDNETESWMKYILYDDPAPLQLKTDECTEFFDEIKKTWEGGNTDGRFRVPVAIMDSKNETSISRPQQPPIAQTDKGVVPSITTKASSNHLLDEATATDTSFRSRSSIEKPLMQNLKRKGGACHYAEDSEFQIKHSDCRSCERKTTSASRSRSVEVHNLSERRRRDRINEKMKELRDLIPHHTNKTDKASMLGEAINYLKWLHHQIQIMWLTNGMGASIFPNKIQRQHMSLHPGIGGIGQSSLMPSYSALPGALPVPPSMYDYSMPWMNPTLQTDTAAAAQPQMPNFNVPNFNSVQPPHDHETSNLFFGYQPPRMPPIHNGQPSHHSHADAGASTSTIKHGKYS